MSRDINVLALVKGQERYIFLFDDSRRAETLRTLGRYASDPDLSFSWYDAAVLSQNVRQAGQPVPMAGVGVNRIKISGAGESSGPLPSDMSSDNWSDDIWVGDEPLP